MRGERLRRALADGVATLPPEGRILVLRPRAGDDLTALPADRTVMATGYRPDHDAFAAAGHTVTARPEGEFSAALVCLPRARDHARALLATAVAHVAPGGPILVDGQKTDGIAAVRRELDRAGTNPGPALAKAHGRIFAFAAQPLPPEWAAQDRQVDGFITRPGVFSANTIDPGSALLAAHLPTRLPARMVDLGAGWGYLATQVLGRDGVTECHLVEAEAEALDCARRNIADLRARFHWADALHFNLTPPADGVVCNPPFHLARQADPALGAAFITAAARLLTPSGRLWLVANRHLPYQSVLDDRFRDVAVIAEDRAFRCWQAARPRRDTSR